MAIQPSEVSAEVYLLAAYPFFSQKLNQRHRAALGKVSRLCRAVVEAGSVPSLLSSQKLDEESPLAPFMVKEFPYLEECSCYHAPADKRNWISSTLAAVVASDQTLIQKKPITIQSVGCGGCLRELILSVQLYQTGVQQIRLILLDPSGGMMVSNWVPSRYLKSQKKPDLSRTVESLSRFFHLFLPRLQVTIDAQKSTPAAYIEAGFHIQPDILLLIDIDFFAILETSFDALKKGGALRSDTLVGWTRSVEMNADMPQSKVFVQRASSVCFAGQDRLHHEEA